MGFLLPIAVILVGLILGSFLNVCIFRLPRGISIVFPHSTCPHCGRAIRPWENVPLLSYLALRGKCAGCRQPISWVYPTVEFLNAAGYLALYLKYGLSTAFLMNGILCSLLIVLVFIDLFERILPDTITLSGCLAGFVLSPLQSPDFLSAPGSIPISAGWLNAYVNSFAGLVFGGGFLWAVAFLYFKIRRIEGMGFGDVKMMAMVGAFLGWQFSWLTILVGSLLGAVIGGVYIWAAGHGRRYELPFGSFLGIGAYFVSLGGADFLNWYLGMIFPK